MIQPFLSTTLKNKHQFLPIVTFNFSMWNVHPPHIFSWLVQHALFIPDGIGISFVLFFRHFQWVPRYPGIDLADDLLKLNPNATIALIGGTKDVLIKVNQYMKKKYPTLIICFKKDGFSKLTNEDFTKLKKAEPDIILVAKGCPKQDMVIHELSQWLDSGIAIGIGGSFDIWSGHKKGHPKSFKKLDLNGYIE